MKITLDISKLVEDGKLTPAEAEQLKTLASHETGSVAINILIGFGVVAVAGGAVALVPTPLTAVGLGLGLFAAGFAIVFNRSRNGGARPNLPGDRRVDVLRRRRGLWPGVARAHR